MWGQPPPVLRPSEARQGFLRAASTLKQRRRRPIQQFLRPQLFQFFLHSPQRALTRKFRGPKFPGRNIQRRKSHALSHLRDRGQKIIFVRPQRRIRRRSWRDHPRHFPPYQFLGEAWIFHLLANRDLESLANQLSDVPLGRVIGHAAHGNRDSFFFIAGGQRDLQLFRRHHGIVEEQFVEVAQPEKQECGGMIFLDRGILPHQRSGGLGHLPGRITWSDQARRDPGGLPRIITKRAACLLRHFACVGGKLSREIAVDSGPLPMFSFAVFAL